MNCKKKDINYKVPKNEKITVIYFLLYLHTREVAAHKVFQVKHTYWKSKLPGMWLSWQHLLFVFH